MFIQDHHALIIRHAGETLRIEAWGKDSLRIRSTMYPSFTEHDWALTEKTVESEPVIEINEKNAFIHNGRISLCVNPQGVFAVYKDDTMIFREYFRNYEGTLSNERI